MKNLKISDSVLAKLKAKHNVTRSEVEQCFANRKGRLLVDNRVLHKTTPPTLWFVAQTNKGRSLKILYIQRGQDVDLRSAFPPNEDENRIYSLKG